MSWISQCSVLLACVTCCLATQILPGAHKYEDMFATDDDADGNHEIVGCRCPMFSNERCIMDPPKNRYLPVGGGACRTIWNKFYRCTVTGLKILGCCDNMKMGKKGVAGLNAKTSGYYYPSDGLEYKGRRGGITKKGTVTCSTNYRYTFHSNTFKNANQISSREPISFDGKEDVVELDEEEPDTSKGDKQPLIPKDK